MGLRAVHAEKARRRALRSRPRLSRAPGAAGGLLRAARFPGEEQSLGRVAGGIEYARQGNERSGKRANHHKHEGRLRATAEIKPANGKSQRWHIRQDARVWSD